MKQKSELLCSGRATGRKDGIHQAHFKKLGQNLENRRRKGVHRYRVKENFAEGNHSSVHISFVTGGKKEGKCSLSRSRTLPRNKREDNFDPLKRFGRERGKKLLFLSCIEVLVI